MKRILVLDDEQSIIQVIRFALEKEGCEVHAFTNPEDALGALKKQFFDILLTDLSMPSISGLDVIKQARDISPQTGMIIMTAYGTMKVAIEAMREGAQDFIPKPFEIKHLIASIHNVLDKMKLQNENTILKKIISKKIEKKDLLGKSSVMRELAENIQKVAASDSNVLISGETGTGKELIARKIHAESPRCEQAFIPVNCSAIPEHLLESELFGYRKGAFTGADTDKMGLFEACENGTIFLDEVGEIPFGLQAKLLRVLAEGKFIPLGSTQEKNVDVRVLAATHQNLPKRIEEGLFREDLYYRINVVEISVPPLRNRKEDIPLLSEHFLKKNAKEYSKDIKGFSEAALEKLCDYDFPGNIRELEHTIEQSIVFEETDLISEENIKIHKRDQDSTSATLRTHDLENDLVEIEKEMIQKALEDSNQNKTQAAKRLGISFRSLRYRLQKLGMTEGE